MGNICNSRTTQKCCTYWIIITIAIEVQAVDRFGVEVGGIVRRDESAPFGAVIPGVAIIQAGIISTTIAAGTKMGILATAISVYLFYHFLRPQSRKSLPDRIGLRDFNFT